jgi:hypothetical protein
MHIYHNVAILIFFRMSKLLPVEINAENLCSFFYLAFFLYRRLQFLYAITYSPEIAQNNADYMKQIIDMASSL